MSKERIHCWVVIYWTGDEYETESFAMEDGSRQGFFRTKKEAQEIIRQSALRNIFKMNEEGDPNILGEMMYYIVPIKNKVTLNYKMDMKVEIVGA